MGGVGEGREVSGGFFSGHSCPLAHFAVDTLDNCLQQWLEPRWMDGTRLHCPECMCACMTLHPFPTGNFLLPFFFFLPLPHFSLVCPTSSSVFSACKVVLWSGSSVTGA